MAKKTLSLSKYRNSYRAGIIQSKAFRILKKKTNEALAPYKLNATDWGILGLLRDTKEGMTHKRIASEIGVKAPYVTRSMKTLLERKFIQLISNKKDTRVKIARITKRGITFVDTTEPKILKIVLHVFDKAGTLNLMGYARTLLSIVEQHALTSDESGNLDALSDEV